MSCCCRKRFPFPNCYSSPASLMAGPLTCTESFHYYRPCSLTPAPAFVNTHHSQHTLLTVVYIPGADISLPLMFPDLLSESSLSPPMGLGYPQPLGQKCPLSPLIRELSHAKASICFRCFLTSWPLEIFRNAMRTFKDCSIKAVFFVVNLKY